MVTCQRGNRTAIEAVFVHVLELAREARLMQLGAVSIDGTKIDANTSGCRFIHYDRSKELREKLVANIVLQMEGVEMANITDLDTRSCWTHWSAARF